LTEQDRAYKERVAHILANQIATAFPLLTADTIAKIAEAIKTEADLKLKTHQERAFEDDPVARSGDGFNESASLARKRRSFENAAIEAAFDYTELMRGINTAFHEHIAGSMTAKELVAQSVRSHTDTITARVEADAARDTRTFKLFVAAAAVMLVILWMTVLFGSVSIFTGIFVSLVILVSHTICFFAYNPYDHK
jgi:hypothetical protein